MLPSLALVSLFALAKAVPPVEGPSSRCVGTISSLSDVDAAVQCTTVQINGFTVPPGEKFTLNLMQGTTVTVLGEIKFEFKNWEGPLLEVTGRDITFNGNKQSWDGGGPHYWDGKGGASGGKPSPMMLFAVSGTISDVHILNSPERALAINAYNGPLVVSGVKIDDSQGEHPNEKSNGRPAGHNTDGFDICGDDIVVQNSVVINQDDCVAINTGKNILIQDNYCEGGNGISIGSIGSDTVVEGVVIRGNTLINNQQAFRIKTDQQASNSRVTNVTYSDNKATNCTVYGVLITQSYPANFATPGSGVAISDVNFKEGPTDITVANDAKMVSVNCGACSGKWDWSGLSVSGGKTGQVVNSPVIAGYET